MKKYPQNPEDWKDGKQIIYRDFTFQSTPDIECLMRLVKDNIPDRGNDKFLRARLLGILFSMFSKANRRFWTRHYHPKTWRFRIFWQDLRHGYNRMFNTKKFRGEVMLYNLSVEVCNEMIKEEQKKA